MWDEERAKTFLLKIFEENASRCIYQVQSPSPVLVSVVLSNCKSEHMMCVWKRNDLHSAFVVSCRHVSTVCRLTQQHTATSQMVRKIMINWLICEGLWTGSVADIYSRHFIRYTLLLGWSLFSLQNSLEHRFKQVLETFLGRFGPYWHNSVTSAWCWDAVL